ARLEAERKAAEEAARLDAERQAAKEAARLEAERQAVEEALRLEEEERAAVEEAIVRERERQAAEAAARLEAARKAAEEAARLEVQRKAEEEAQRRSLAESQPPVAVATAKTPEQTVVMIADDSRVVRVKTGRLLSAHQYQVLTAEDGLDAAQQIGNSLPDVLVTDVDMPGLNGLELARQLRGDPRSAHLPIIMVTSDSDQLRSEADAAGVDVLLGKPYPEDELIAHIQRLVAARNGA
uniref:response regulator n=1 Tax=Accumulibacter sp. TaxID=2053492 RepID=UPI0028C4FD6D